MTDQHHHHHHHHCQPDYRSPIVAVACCQCGDSVSLSAVNLDATPRTLHNRLRDVWRAIAWAWRASR